MRVTVPVLTKGGGLPLEALSLSLPTLLPREPVSARGVGEASESVKTPSKARFQSTNIPGKINKEQCQPGIETRTQSQICMFSRRRISRAHSAAFAPAAQQRPEAGICGTSAGRLAEPESLLPTLRPQGHTPGLPWLEGAKS